MSLNYSIFAGSKPSTFGGLSKSALFPQLTETIDSNKAIINMFINLYNIF